MSGQQYCYHGKLFESCAPCILGALEQRETELKNARRTFKDSLKVHAAEVARLRAALEKCYTITPAMMAALRADPTTTIDDSDEWRSRIGWLICAFDVLKAALATPRDDEGRVG